MLSLTERQLKNMDDYSVLKIGMVLKKLFLSKIQSITAGASGATVKKYALVASNKLELKAVKLVINTAVVGTGNVCTVKVKNETTGNELIGSGIEVDVADTEAAGTVKNGTVTDDYKVINAGDVISVYAVNAAGTITTPLEANVQLDYQYLLDD